MGTLHIHHNVLFLTSLNVHAFVYIIFTMQGFVIVIIGIIFLFLFHFLSNSATDEY